MAAETLKMKQNKYELPSITFPYKITRRLNILSVPRKYYVETNEGMPAFSSFGIRQSALKGHISDRVNDASWPYIRRLLILKRQYKQRFPPERLQRLDRMIEASNATCYTKLANCGVNLKTQGDNYKDLKKKKAWNESEWKKHTDYILGLCKPKKLFEAEPIPRGPQKKLEELLPRLEGLAQLPELKLYRPLSQEAWYKDPQKVSPKALQYNISERVKKLAEPRALPAPES